MKSKCLLDSVSVTLFLAVFSVYSAHSQSCGCDYTVGPSESIVDNNSLQLPAGSTICISAGERDNLTFKNFRTDDASNRFLFQNCGGQAIIHNTILDRTGLTFSNCKNFHVSGAGEIGVEYGILIEGSPTSDGYNTKWGLTCVALSTDFEIDHVEVSKIDFAGFGLKTDVRCDDESTWRKNFTMRNISVHDNFVDITANGEGFYIGYFKYDSIECHLGEPVYPHNIQGIDVYGNVVQNTGADGIQVDGADLDCRIFNNSIRDYGVDPFSGTSDQTNGIQIGDGTVGLVYNNFIKAHPDKQTANGIVVFGVNNVLFNNVIVDSYTNGMYFDEHYGTDTGPNSGYRIYNNTIINPKGYGINMQNETVANNWVKNNIIIKASGSGYINKHPDAPMDESNNLKAPSVDDAMFVNSSADDYHLTSSSPCIDAGINLYNDFVTIDFDSNPRPTSGPFDQGAFEFQGDTGGGADLVWHSYEISTQNDAVQQGIVTSETQNVEATIQFYQSTNDGGVDQGALFSIFNAGTHTDPNAHAENYWANETGNAYPFAGLSTIGRGSDTGEGATPPPLDVMDLQLHPPQDQKLTVAAFIAPVDGTYSVSELGVRRVMIYGDSVTFKVFDSNKSLKTSLIATKNRDWVVSASSISLGTLAVGDRIYFATDNTDTWAFDFTEVTFTITATPIQEGQSWHSYDIQTQNNPSQQGIVNSNQSTPATIEFYQSTDDFGVNKGSVFSTFNQGEHTDPNAHARDYWANGTGSVYPFAGLSTVGRGSDTGEGNAPEPAGVFDLQLHPPQDNKMTVAAFIVPVSCSYSVSDLAVRRVMTYGDSVTFKVFDNSKNLVASLIATNNRDWVVDPSPISLGALAAGDRIYFATENTDTWAFDFTEVAWGPSAWKRKEAVLQRKTHLPPHTRTKETRTSVYLFTTAQAITLKPLITFPSPPR